MKERKKIGVLGGTFNPIHAGHLLLANWAREEAGLDEILFIPTGRSYQKNDEEVASPRQRLEMLRLALEGKAGFRISEMEIRRPGNSYTYATMEALGRELPFAELWFILGADCLHRMEDWVYPERIFGACTILAASRNGSPMEELQAKKHQLEERFGARIKLMSFPAIEISSTMIRDRIRRGLSLEYLLPDPVISYIKKERLYENIGKQADPQADEKMPDGREI